MLVCQRNISTEVEIREVVLSLLRQDPWAIVVPAKVYRDFDKRRSAATAYQMWWTSSPRSPKNITLGCQAIRPRGPNPARIGL